MEERALLITDLVDSTRLVEGLGDVGAARVSQAHDRVARDLLAPHGGLEIDKTDGFLLLFASVADAVAYASAYHRALTALSAELGVPLAARAGVHWGPVILRRNPPEDVARGAKPLEVEGIAKPTAARIMSVAPGARTLGSRAAVDRLDGAETRIHSHGHWHLKGLSEPLELFELRDDDDPPSAPVDGAKVYRVAWVDGVWQPVAAIPNNLPFLRDSFVGREGDLAEIDRQLEAGAPIVTLLGPGGTGKTRLSIEFGRRNLGSWPGGVWLAELELVRDADALLSALAKALNIKLMGTDPAAWLAGVLRSRGRTLLVLDNFEQLVSAAPLVERLSTLAPETSWIVSSRAALHVAGEHVIHLEPLALPQRGDEVAAIRANPAVRLLLDRATAVAPRFVRSDDDLRDVAELVRVLEGLPLALELAAGRAAMMSAGKMVQRISERFRLLAGGRTGAPRRHATLRGAIDWSWELLEPWERHALAQCAVFQGGFTLEAAEAVIDLSAWPGAPWAEDAIQALLDKSLLRRWTPIVGGAQRHDLTEPLFGMYVSIHEYVAEKLADPKAIDVEPRVTGPDASRALRLRHATYFGSDPEPRLQAAAVHPLALDQDRENLVAAFETAVVEREPVLAVGAFRLLCLLGVRLGPASLGADRLARIDLDALPDPLALSCLNAAITALRRVGRFQELIDAYTRILAIAERTGNRREILRARAELIVGGRFHDVDVAALREVLAEARAAGFDDVANPIRQDIAILSPGRSGEEDLRGLALEPGRVGAMARHNLGVMMMAANRPEETLELGRGCIAFARQERSAFVEMLGNANVGQALAMLGHPDARASLERAIEIATILEDRRFAQGASASVLTILDFRDGRLDAARSRLDRSLPMLRALGDRRELALALAAQALLCHAVGDADGVRAAFDEIEGLMPAWRDEEMHDARWIRELRAEIDAA